ncbi:MAG: histidine phosphatase family protein [Pseudomonadota bacterium]
MEQSTHPPSPARTGRRRLYLMRHGHVDYFKPGLTDPRQVPLTEEGQGQARATAATLAPVPFDFALCSGLPRTRETAEIVLAAQDAASPDVPVLGEDLRFEELKSGWIKAGSREELAARLAYCFDDAHDANARFLPDGESFGEAEARIVDGLTAIVTQGQWKTGLLVAHEGVNRLILGWACGGGLATIGAFEQDLCAVNVIDFDITPAEAVRDQHVDTPRAARNGVQVERAILKLVNVTAYDPVKEGLRKTCLEHLFDIDFGASRPPRPARSA